MKRIRVPEFLKAAIRNSARFLDTGNQALCDEQVETVAQAVCKSLMEHPQVPTDEQARDVLRNFGYGTNDWDTPFAKQYMEAAKKSLVDWQRRCFIQEEPEIEEFMECDTCRAKSGSPYLCRGCWHNRQVIENLRNTLRKGEQK